jgi:HAD superfamily hydrolase (TIGR01509 family)
VSFDLVIFDCDGVLIDSEPIATRAHAETLALCGYAIGEDTLLERFCGVSDADMLAAIEREWGRALPPDYQDRLALRLEEEYRRALRPIPGIREALSALALPLCVASSSAPARLRLGLEIAGLLEFFEPHLFSATMVARGKPAPDLFLHAAARMGATPRRSFVIEDSLTGVEAARDAAMTALGFCGGSHCRPGHGERLSASGAGLVLQDMRDLPAAIARLC